MPGWGTSWGTGWGGTSKKLVGLVVTGSISFDSAAVTTITANYITHASISFSSIDILTVASSGGIQLASIVFSSIDTLLGTIRESGLAPKIVVPQKQLLVPKVAILHKK